MGVDAEMFVRIQGRDNWLTEREVVRKAYEIGSTIGPEAFFTSLPAESFSGEARRALSIVPPLMAETARDYGLDQGLIGRVVWTQDGPEIIAGEDEQFIEVSLWGRYYGPGYERGHWPTLRTVIEWCRVNLPGEVWYGGDSSGICAEPMTPARIAAMDRHYFANGHRPYLRYRGVFEKAVQPAIECQLCLEPMYETGWGRGQTLFRCDGCGREAVRSASGGVRHLKRGEDWMSLARETVKAEGQS